MLFLHRIIPVSWHRAALLKWDTFLDSDSIQISGMSKDTAPTRSNSLDVVSKTDKPERLLKPNMQPSFYTAMNPYANNICDHACSKCVTRGSEIPRPSRWLWYWNGDNLTKLYHELHTGCSLGHRQYRKRHQVAGSPDGSTATAHKRSAWTTYI